MRSRCRNTPLHHAAENEHAVVVAALLAHGAAVNAKNKGGCGTPPWPTGTGSAQCMQISG
jgi:ankyrin repeat protein